MPLLLPVLLFRVRRNGEMSEDPDKDPVQVRLMIRHDDEVGWQSEVRSRSLRVWPNEDTL